MDAIIAVFVGVFVGIVCVGGLFFGIRLLIRIQVEGEKIEKSRKLRMIALAIGVLVGQLLVAAAILYGAPQAKTHPIPLALGLVSVNFLLPLIISRSKSDQ